LTPKVFYSEDYISFQSYIYVLTNVFLNFKLILSYGSLAKIMLNGAHYIYGKEIKMSMKVVRKITFVHYIEAM